MSEDKTYPTHRISFAEKTIDGRGQEKLGSPVEVASIWPRKNGKQGGYIQWHISPQSLKDGAYFMLENNLERKQAHQQDQFDRAEQRHADQGRDQGLEH